VAFRKSRHFGEPRIRVRGGRRNDEEAFFALSNAIDVDNFFFYQ
jgi:hypothetical protein